MAKNNPKCPLIGRAPVMVGLPYVICKFSGSSGSFLQTIVLLREFNIKFMRSHKSILNGFYLLQFDLEHIASFSLFLLFDFHRKINV